VKKISAIGKNNGEIFLKKNTNKEITIKWENNNSSKKKSNSNKGRRVRTGEK